MRMPMRITSASCWPVRNKRVPDHPDYAARMPIFPVLAVTLYGITRAEDHELAILGLVCRG